MDLRGRHLNLLSEKEMRESDLERIICIVIGYVFGLFQTAFIYGKLHGIDIREHGSGNAGTTNTLRVLGTKAGLIVLAGDIIKCILAIVLCSVLFDTSHPDEIYLLKLYAAAGAILGHNFPFYLGFKGGKGIAATAGLILAFHPYFIIMGVILFLQSSSSLIKPFSVASITPSSISISLSPVSIIFLVKLKAFLISFFISLTKFSFVLS